MSCAEVMYQPYSPYFPVYQRGQVASTGVSALTPSQAQASSDYRRFCASKCTDSDGSHSGSPAASSTAECRLRTSTSRAAEVADCRDKEKADAQYVSANCVVFTYYTGDISTVVDEHFSRALSQAPAAAAAGYSPVADTSHAEKPNKDCPPMSHRNFPPSFWNSNYQPASNSGLTPGSLGHLSVPDLGYGADPYHHHHHHHNPTAALHASLHHHHQNADPWHYALSGQAGPYRSHDLSSYHPGVTGTSRFNPQYGSLLLQPSVRSAATRLGPAAAAAACATGLDKTATETWGSARYHDPIGHVDPNYAPTYGGMTSMSGLEGQPQDSKDLYWF